VAETNTLWSELNASKVPNCMAQLYDTYFAQRAAQDPSLARVKIGKSHISRFAVDGVGDRGSGLTGTIPLSAPGQSITLHFDYAFAQRGRAEIFVSYLHQSPQVDRALENQLLTTIVERLGSKAS